MKYKGIEPLAQGLEPSMLPLHQYFKVYATGFEHVLTAPQTDVLPLH